jgi:UDP-glucuronate 4-epimerase
VKGEKVLVTGATGQVGFPVARALAADNDVWAMARFATTDFGPRVRSSSARTELERAGARCVVADLADLDLSGVPDDFTYVVHLGVSKTNNWDVDLAGNVEALGRLLSHCQRAKGFLHCSSTGVYRVPRGHRSVESDPVGDNRNVASTYRICKISSEAMARFGCRHWSVPTLIARLNVPYGDNGGLPLMHLEDIVAGRPISVHSDGPVLYNPIHEDDIVADVPGLLAAASIPATLVNWGGDEEVSVESWCSYLGDLVARPPVFTARADGPDGSLIDLSKLRELVGATTVPWQKGMRRMVEATHLELLQAASEGA